MQMARRADLLDQRSICRHWRPLVAGDGAFDRGTHCLEEAGATR